MRQTNRISSFLPRASAYRCSTGTDGQRPLESPVSSRATADWLVPIRWATTSWLKPAANRWSLIRANSSSSAFACRKPSRNSGFCICSARVSSKDLSGLFIFKLPLSVQGNFEIFCRRFLALFNKAMKNHNPPTDSRAIHHAAYSLLSHGPDLKQAVTHGSGVRHPEIRPVDFHSIQQSKSSLSDCHRQFKKLLTGIFIHKFDCERFVNRLRFLLRRSHNRNMQFSTGRVYQN